MLSRLKCQDLPGLTTAEHSSKRTGRRSTRRPGQPPPNRVGHGGDDGRPVSGPRPGARSRAAVIQGQSLGWRRRGSPPRRSASCGRSRGTGKLVQLRTSCKDQVHGVLTKLGIEVTCWISSAPAERSGWMSCRCPTGLADLIHPQPAATSGTTCNSPTGIGILPGPGRPAAHLLQLRLLGLPGRILLQPAVCLRRSHRSGVQRHAGPDPVRAGHPALRTLFGAAAVPASTAQPPSPRVGSRSRHLRGT